MNNKYFRAIFFITVIFIIGFIYVKLYVKSNDSNHEENESFSSSAVNENSSTQNMNGDLNQNSDNNSTVPSFENVELNGILDSKLPPKPIEIPELGKSLDFDKMSEVEKKIFLDLYSIENEIKEKSHKNNLEEKYELKGGIEDPLIKNKFNFNTNSSLDNKIDPPKFD